MTAFRSSFLVLLLLTGLGACGYRPLYADRAADRAAGPEAGVAAQLAAIEVALIEDRFGQVLRHRLRDRLAPGGAAADRLYWLEVEYRRNVDELAFRKDETATLARLTYDARYTLRRGDAVLTSGESRAISSYDLLRAPYATVVAERDAEERIAQQLADEIALRLGMYFADRGDGAR